jgi:hypothetical protein
MDRKIVLKLILRHLWETVDWVNLNQNRNEWEASVFTVMNFLVPYKMVSLLIS